MLHVFILQLNFYSYFYHFINQYFSSFHSVFVFAMTTFFNLE